MKTSNPVLAPESLHRIDSYWRAANYLSVAQICLLGNPLLRRPLALPDIKHMLLGLWGTTRGQNFIYVEGREPALMREAMSADGRVGHLPEAATPGQADRTQAVHQQARRGHAEHSELEVGAAP